MFKKINSIMADTTIKFDGSSHELEKLRIKILFEQSSAAQFSGLIVAALYIYLFRAKASLSFLEVWAASLILITAARVFLIRRFSHYNVKLNRDFDPYKWENIFAGFTGSVGVMWGLAVCAAVPVGDLPVDSLFGFILAGITAGAAVAYNTSLKSTYTFFLTSLVPFMIRLAFKNDEAYWSMTFMVFAYSMLFLKLTHRFNQYAVKSIILSYQKDQLIQRIRLMQSQVTQSAQMAALGQMAGGMAHEINNPLAIIVASSDLIQIVLDRKDTVKLLKDTTLLLNKILTASGRIARIIKDLSCFAGGPPDEQCVITSITKILESAMNLCNERFKAYDVMVNVEPIPPQLLIECQPFHITHAVLNLLNNSFDAVWERNKKWINIEVLDLGEEIEIGVTDSGTGIPEEIRSKIMQPFFSTKEVGKGMGLGLSIATGIVESHKGRLWLDAGAPNTRFAISLPKRKRMEIKEAA